MSYGDSSLDGLAAFIAANYMGLGKSAMDTKPELRRRGVVNAGQDMYSMGGQMMSAPEIASALRLQGQLMSALKSASTPCLQIAPWGKGNAQALRMQVFFSLCKDFVLACKVLDCLHSPSHVQVWNCDAKTCRVSHLLIL
eukprot:scaffold241091_cov22-Tisochrysis_lutea.AAC.1